MAAGRRSVAPNQGGFAGLPLPRCGIMSQRSVKWLIHLFQFAPLKSGMTTSIWRQEGTHGTKTKTSYARICLRDSSCDGSDHPSDHNARFGCADLVTDLPSPTCACVLKAVATQFFASDPGRPPACCCHQRRP